MDISTKHANAVIAACRIPALTARLALLQADPQGQVRARIHFYGTPKADPPGSAPGDDPIVTLTLTAGAGIVNPDTFQMLIATPLETQVENADPTTGTIPVWARLEDPSGDWWADFTVSAEGGGGELQMVATGLEGDPPVPVVRWFNGAFARLQSGTVQG